MLINFTTDMYRFKGAGNQCVIHNFCLSSLLSICYVIHFIVVINLMEVSIPVYFFLKTFHVYLVICFYKM